VGQHADLLADPSTGFDSGMPPAAASGCVAQPEHVDRQQTARCGFSVQRQRAAVLANRGSRRWNLDEDRMTGIPLTDDNVREAFGKSHGDALANLAYMHHEAVMAGPKCLRCGKSVDDPIHTVEVK